MRMNELPPAAQSSAFQDLDALWDHRDPAGSEAAFRALMPNARLLGTRERSSLIELLSLIARAQGVQGRFREAHATLEEARQLLEENEATYRVSAKIRWLLERGRLQILEK